MLQTQAFLCVVTAWAAAAAGKKFTWPVTANSTKELGELSSPGINRDSCGTSRFFDRILWVCRDTQPTNAKGAPIDPVWSSSASWANLTVDGGPTLDVYGGNGSRTAYYPYAEDECTRGHGPLEGTCDTDNTRFANWPDTPPLITSNTNGKITAYTWVRQSHIRMDLSSVVKDPLTSLYKVTYSQDTKDRNTLPTATLTKEKFWARDTIPYGSYGNLIYNGTAYLFGQPSNGHIALARVAPSKVEDVSAYEYYVDNAWVSKAPNMTDPAANIPNAGGGGQGTFFFSKYWNKFVWIGQVRYSVSPDFFITVADKIEGPWEDPVLFYKGKGGTFKFPGYSLQAHPSMSKTGLVMDTNEIWISFTKVDKGPINIYYHPLIKVTWN